MLFEMTTAEAEAAEWALFVAESAVENDPSSVSTRDLVQRVEGLRGRLSAKLSSEEAANRLLKVSGVAASQAVATDIGYAMQTVEGFPTKQLQWEMVGKDTDGTPIYRNNWGAYDPWIPNRVRMPPVGEWVLCYSKHRGCETARVEKHWYGWVTKDKKNLVPDAYTHWMPMPPPPGTTP